MEIRALVINNNPEEKIVNISLIMAMESEYIKHLHLKEL